MSSKKQTLYQISGALDEIADFLTSVDGDISDPEIEAKIDAWMAELLEARDDKILATCMVIQNMKTQAERCKAEAQRIQRIQKVNENGAERLEKRLEEFFKHHGLQKLDLGFFKPRFQRNSRATLVYPEHWETAPPKRFQKSTLDSKALQAYLAEAPLLCPTCGEMAERVPNVEPASESEEPQPEIFKCSICEWSGGEGETVRFVVGQHFRLR